MSRTDRSYAIGDIAVSLLVLILFSAVFISAYGMPGRSGLFPRHIAGWALAFAALDFGIRIWKLRQATANSTTDPPLRLVELGAMAWPLLLVGMIYLLGFAVAIPLFMLAFFLARTNVNWLAAASVILGFSVFSFVIFTWWLNVRLYGGILELAPW